MDPELSLDWEEEMATAQPHDCVSVPSDHPLYVLYTSGTTGTPKVLSLWGRHGQQIKKTLWKYAVFFFPSQVKVFTASLCVQLICFLAKLRA